jgi:hypothetical protein
MLADCIGDECSANKDNMKVWLAGVHKLMENEPARRIFR